MILKGVGNLIVISLLCLFMSMTLSAASKKHQITILSKSYSGYKLNIAKSIEVSPLNKSSNVKADTLENWDPTSKTNLYIALDIDSLEALQNQKITTPVMAALITSNQWSLFNEKYPDNKFNSIFYDPDPLRQILLAKAIQPSLSSIGILRSPKYSINENRINNLARDEQLQINIRINRNNDNFYEEYAKLSNNNDAILLTPDKAIYNRDSIPKAILTSYRQNKFIIGYSRSIVKSGAIATTFTNPKDYISDLVDTASKILVDNNLVTRRYSQNYSVTTNDKVAKSMELILPSTDELKEIVNKSLENIDAVNR